jgi:hypothetical protein
MSRSILLWAACVVLAIAALAAAQETARPSDLVEVEALIEQLDRPEFAQRQEASQKLSELGKAAFDHLERAVSESSRETSSRALDVLKGHFERGDNDTKAAARQALERLAQNGNSAIAQRAQLVLNPPPPPTAQDVAMIMRQAAPVRVANLQIQIGGNALPARGRSVTTSRTGNGDVKIQVRENGKTTKIEAAAGGKIQIEITEPQNGKEITRAYEVKDLDELKKKDAEVARLYEQYHRPAQIQVGAFGPAGAIVPGGFPGPALPIAPPVPIAQQQAEIQKRVLESIEAQIQQRKAQLPNNPAAQRTIESLERMKEQIKQRTGEVARPAPPAAEAKAAGGQ